MEVHVQQLSLMFLYKINYLFPGNLSISIYLNFILRNEMHQLIFVQTSYILIGGIISVLNLAQESVFKFDCVCVVVHFFDDSSPHPFFDYAGLDAVLFK